MPPVRLTLILLSAGALALSGCASRRPAAASDPLGQASAAGSMTAQTAGQTPGGGGAFSNVPSLGSEAARALAAEFAQRAGERVFFDFDRHDLDGRALATLDAQAEWLRQRPQLRVLLAGHADERGTREYNLALGSRRAEAARAYLVGRGVEPGRIETVSYGKERPLDPRSNEEGWAQNRNAQTVLVDLVSGP
jgi:peptidoglycan-associated lipoprotein